MTQPQQIDRSSFDLNEVASNRRASRWRDTLNEFFFRHENGTAPDFRVGQFTGTGTQDVRIATFASDPMFCERTSSHVAKDCIDGYFIVAPTHGDITLVQGGREVALRQGRFSLVAIDGAHKFQQPGQAGFHGILIPGAVFRARRPDIDDHTARDFASTGALQSMFTDYMASFCRNAAHLDDRALRNTTEHLTDMLSLLVDGIDPASDETAVQIAHRRRAQKFIEANFHDPGLNVLSIAQSLGLSERYVQKIFSANGETVSSVVRKRRVAEAGRLLDRREGSRASIATIAYRTGFADPSHFSRVFRQQTGLSPMEWTLRSAERSSHPRGFGASRP